MVDVLRITIENHNATEVSLLIEYLQKTNLWKKVTLLEHEIMNEDT